VTQAAVRIHELATLPAEWRSQALANSLVTHGVSQLLGAAGATLGKHRELSDALGEGLPESLYDLGTALDTLENHSRNARLSRCACS